MRKLFGFGKSSKKEKIKPEPPKIDTSPQPLKINTVTKLTHDEIHVLKKSVNAINIDLDPPEPDFSRRSPARSVDLPRTPWKPYHPGNENESSTDSNQSQTLKIKRKSSFNSVATPYWKNTESTQSTYRGKLVDKQVYSSSNINIPESRNPITVEKNLRSPNRTGFVQSDVPQKKEDAFEDYKAQLEMYQRRKSNMFGSSSASVHLPNNSVDQINHSRSGSSSKLEKMSGFFKKKSVSPIQKVPSTNSLSSVIPKSPQKNSNKVRPKSKLNNEYFHPNENMYKRKSNSIYHFSSDPTTLPQIGTFDDDEKLGLSDILKDPEFNTRSLYDFTPNNSQANDSSLGLNKTPPDTPKFGKITPVSKESTPKPGFKQSVSTHKLESSIPQNFHTESTPIPAFSQSYSQLSKYGRSDEPSLPSSAAANYSNKKTYSTYSQTKTYNSFSIPSYYGDDYNNQPKTSSSEDLAQNQNHSESNDNNNTQNTPSIPIPESNINKDADNNLKRNDSKRSFTVNKPASEATKDNFDSNENNNSLSTTPRSYRDSFTRLQKAVSIDVSNSYFDFSFIENVDSPSDEIKVMEEHVNNTEESPNYPSKAGNIDYSDSKNGSVQYIDQDSSFFDTSINIGEQQKPYDNDTRIIKGDSHVQNSIDDLVAENLAMSLFEEVSSLKKQSREGISEMVQQSLNFQSEVLKINKNVKIVGGRGNIYTEFGGIGNESRYSIDSEDLSKDLREIQESLRTQAILDKELLNIKAISENKLHGKREKELDFENLRCLSTTEKISKLKSEFVEINTKLKSDLIDEKNKRNAVELDVLQSLKQNSGKVKELANGVFTIIPKIANIHKVLTKDLDRKSSSEQHPVEPDSNINSQLIYNQDTTVSNHFTENNTLDKLSVKKEVSEVDKLSGIDPVALQYEFEQVVESSNIDNKKYTSDYNNSKEIKQFMGRLNCVLDIVEESVLDKDNEIHKLKTMIGNLKRDLKKEQDRTNASAKTTQSKSIELIKTRMELDDTVAKKTIEAEMFSDQINSREKAWKEEKSFMELRINKLQNTILKLLPTNNQATDNLFENENKSATILSRRKHNTVPHLNNISSDEFFTDENESTQCGDSALLSPISLATNIEDDNEEKDDSTDYRNNSSIESNSINHRSLSSTNITPTNSNSGMVSSRRKKLIPNNHSDMMFLSDKQRRASIVDHQFYDKLVNMSERLRKSKEDMVAKTIEFQEKITVLEETNRDLKKEIGEKDAEIQKKSNSMMKATMLVGDIKAESSALEEGLSAVQKEYTKSKIELEETKNLINDYKKQLDDLQNEHKKKTNLMNRQISVLKHLLIKIKLSDGDLSGTSLPFRRVSSLINIAKLPTGSTEYEPVNDEFGLNNRNQNYGTANSKMNSNRLTKKRSLMDSLLSYVPIKTESKEIGDKSKDESQRSSGVDGEGIGKLSVFKNERGLYGSLRGNAFETKRIEGIAMYGNKVNSLKREKKELQDKIIFFERKERMKIGNVVEHDLVTKNKNEEIDIRKNPDFAIEQTSTNKMKLQVMKIIHKTLLNTHKLIKTPKDAFKEFHENYFLQTNYLDNLEINTEEKLHYVCGDDISRDLVLKTAEKLRNKEFWIMLEKIDVGKVEDAIVEETKVLESMHLYELVQVMVCAYEKLVEEATKAGFALLQKETNEESVIVSSSEYASLYEKNAVALGLLKNAYTVINSIQAKQVL
ncbi:hypothetical protein BB559_006858 [Furculomyces boomerangus]|uniref:Uncharacterized protein n=1 Tax=Furculomyces boomerangus TaxID=61424 RepID=A0A2T9Y062_9FUNG|nr:hypothetical protein BB559_006858 [Furculomyces boomerangus]